MLRITCCCRLGNPLIQQEQYISLTRDCLCGEIGMEYINRILHIINILSKFFKKARP